MSFEKVAQINRYPLYHICYLYLTLCNCTLHKNDDMSLLNSARLYLNALIHILSQYVLLILICN